MTDPLDRDRHPMRPDHPDFWRLSEIVLESDAQADEGANIDDVVSPIADLRSVSYMAFQRALRVKTMTGSGVSLLYLSAAWMDGFTAGAKFEQRRLPKQRTGDHDG